MWRLGISILFFFYEIKWIWTVKLENIHSFLDFITWPQTAAYSLRGLRYFYVLKFFRQVNPHIQITVKIMCESIQVWILRGKRPPQCKTTGKRFHICRNMCFYFQQSLWWCWPDKTVPWFATHHTSLLLGRLDRIL